MIPVPTKRYYNIRENACKETDWPVLWREEKIFSGMQEIEDKGRIIKRYHAGMAELADAHDSGSCVQYALAGSSPVSRTRGCLTKKK